MPSLRLFSLSVLAVLPMIGQGAERSVAITIDDVPYQRGRSLAQVQALTDRLVHQFRSHDIPVVAFVNEAKLHDGGPAELAARTALLEEWLGIGAELGNHTYSHININVASLDEYKQDVLRGEEITRRLLSARGMTLRYFRHPFLRTGKDAHTHAELARFLDQQGYIVAPVTIDNDEWIYAAAYDQAAVSNDTPTMRRIAQDYLIYMEQAFAFSEDLARQLFGREIKHVLLIHANALNAEYLDELVAMMKRRGYNFVSLSEALKDDAYRNPDTYIGPRGWSWLLRWANGKRMDTSKAPQVPAYVMELTQVQ